MRGCCPLQANTLVRASSAIGSGCCSAQSAASDASLSDSAWSFAAFSSSVHPRSTSQALAILVLEAAGLKPTEAELVKTGGFGEGIVALDLGAVDITPIPEPLWSQHKEKYRAVVRASDTLPPLDNVVGVTTSKAAAARGDFLRAVLRGRRQAVEFIYANPDDAGAIIAKVYNLSPEVTRDAVRNLTSSHEKTGVRYWGVGNFGRKGMDDMIRAQRLVDALKGDVDWSKIVDESFLADDLKSKK